MLIRFTKPRHRDRQPTMTVVRDDGTTTGQATTQFFVSHDLTHYAVETVLDLRDAFFGLLNQGWDIDSFAERAPGSQKARPVPPEALVAEIVVGTLDIQRADASLTHEWAVGHVLSECRQAGMPPPDISVLRLEHIRRKRDELFVAYGGIAEGETFELAF